MSLVSLALLGGLLGLAAAQSRSPLCNASVNQHNYSVPGMGPDGHYPHGCAGQSGYCCPHEDGMWLDCCGPNPLSPSSTPPLPYYPPRQGYCLQGGDIPEIAGWYSVEDAEKVCTNYYVDGKTCAGFTFEDHGSSFEASFEARSPFCNASINDKPYNVPGMGADGHYPNGCAAQTGYCCPHEDGMWLDCCGPKTFSGPSYFVKFSTEFNPVPATSSSCPSSEFLGTLEAQNFNNWFVVQTMFLYAQDQSIPSGESYRTDTMSYLDAAAACRDDSQCKGYSWTCPGDSCACSAFAFCESKFPASAQFSFVADENVQQPAAGSAFFAVRDPYPWTSSAADSSDRLSVTLV